MKMRRLFESGGSVVIAIPLEMRNTAKMKKGDTVLLTMKDTQTIEIRKVTQAQLLTLVGGGVKIG